MLKNSSLDFRGRVALITGAGKGLGRAYAEWLAARGACVVVNNRRRPGQPSSAESVAAAIRAAGGQAVAIDGAVENEADAAAMVQRARETFGKLDILICNAGISPDGTFHKIDMARFREAVDVNFYGTVYPLRAALPLMREAGYGRIVITTSASAYCGSLGLSAYGSAKAAVIGLARTLAIENASRNIRINVVSPAAYTPMTEPYMPNEQRERLAPKRVAPLVGWFASESCSANAAIVEAGAGRLRRVVFGVGDAVDAPGDDLASIWPVLETPSNISEISDAGKAIETLLD